MIIALAGNPNSGKTTMYNALTGSNEKIGNWSGVTVEKKERLIKKMYYDGEKELIAVDLPGAYSMSPFTSEESITSEYIRNAKADVIINIVDSTNLSRSLFFTTQLLELGIPVVIALNKDDLNRKKNNKIDARKLSELLNCPVVYTTSISSKGLKELINKSLEVSNIKQSSVFKHGNINLNNKEEAEQADRERFKFVNDIVSKVEKRKVFTKNINKQDKLDKVLTNKWLGIPIFAIIMFLVFWISQSGPGIWLADILTGFLEKGQNLVAELLTPENGNMNIWSSILVEGIIGGVIAVVGFLPLVMVMYFLLALLEDCGYMARVSVVLDPIFKKVGLSGKSVIPFVIGAGCAVPGVMACRAIRGDRERRATAMLAPFMPCGAKLPVIALFAAAFFKNSAFIGALMYLIGFVIIIFGALLINLLTGVKNKKSYFIIELPEYKIPDFWKAFISMCDRGWAYIVKAGTIILVCNFAVHVMQNFNWSLEVVNNANESILHDIATPFAYVLAPLIGVCAWQLTAATVTGFIAKENVVGAISVCYVALQGIDLFSAGSDPIIAEQVYNTLGISQVAALSFLMFNLFSPPCFAAIGAMSAEIKSKKWLVAGIVLQLSMGFTVSFLVFFFGTLFTQGSFGQMWMPITGWLIVGMNVLIVSLLVMRNRKKCTI